MGEKGSLIPKEVPPAVATFLSFCDDIVELSVLDGRLGTAMKNGKLTLLLGTSYLGADDEQRVDDLKHEVGHFVLCHTQRCGERDKRRFNMVCDAAISFQGICRVLDSDITFEKLPCKNGGTVPPTPPELAYDMLAEGPPTLVICGSLVNSSSDDSPATKAKLAIIGATIRVRHPDLLKTLAGNMGGSEAGTGRAISEIPPPPPWIREVLEYLLKTTRSIDRRRSWRREHRALPDMLPGLSRSYTPSCIVLFDASGSISEDLASQFLGALSGTPELANSYVRVFDTTLSHPIPVRDIAKVCEAVAEKGGGTLIKKAGLEGRESGIPIVWLTDAESGDGFAPPHDAVEIWCVSGSAPHPHGIRVQVE